MGFPTILEQRLERLFFEGADLQYQAGEVLARTIAEATAALLADPDVLVAVPHKRAARVAGQVVSNAPFLPHSTPGGRYPEHGKSRAEH